MKSNSENIKIDGIDKKILRFLMADARKPVLEIARKIGISGAAIHQRLRKLEASGLIAGSKFIINPKVLGYTTMAYIGIYLDKAMSNPLAVKELQKIPEVLECHYTTGNWSILIKVLCRDNEHLMHVLNRDIQQIEGVSRTETFISLEQQIDRQITI
ncbi:MULTISPECIES: Lrp/AsnC ligand binding domain-containing protein [unclassified Arenibacter]|uniref:Lrp/AsnC ligand binding domain-containing protein n=1 Tax=unclassified Arenibacter TaxID=2615047 RepID=UPI000E351740|nr:MULTISPECIES: Lrp/AsnC ligand binding domain-containing protein [unclassified Arenibacter]MCM4163822.1 transcriptional regulator [Arenibacter sp. A80]RFT56537.1 AsnC family transcriptional regulator [Arenibacter sp. P308M17]